MSETKPVFISHSTNDSKLADLILEFLVKEFHIGTNQIHCSTTDGCGTESADEIVKDICNKIKDTKLFIAIVTNEYINRPWCCYELGMMDKSKVLDGDKNRKVIFINIPLTEEKLNLPLFMGPRASYAPDKFFNALAECVTSALSINYGQHQKKPNKKIINSYEKKLQILVQIRKEEFILDKLVIEIKKNPFYDDFKQVLKLIHYDKDHTFHCSHDFIDTASIDRVVKNNELFNSASNEKIYCIESRYVWPLTDLTLDYFSDLDAKRWFKEELSLPEYHTIRKRVVVVDDPSNSCNPEKFITTAINFLKVYSNQGYDWKILWRSDLEKAGIQMHFREFCIFTYEDRSRLAYFTFLDKRLANLFIKGSWCQYRTTNTDYNDKLGTYFSRLWDLGIKSGKSIEDFTFDRNVQR